MKCKPFLIVFLALVASPLLAQARGDKVNPDFNRWYVLEMQGQRAGWAHTSQTTRGDRIITNNDMSISLRRGPITVGIEQAQRFVESSDGKPIKASSRTKMGQLPVEHRYRFTGKGAKVTSMQGGQKLSGQVVPIKGKWLPPAAAQRYIEQQIARGSKKISVRTLDLSMGVRPVKATMSLKGEQDVEVLGKTVPAIAWETSVSSMSGMKMREYVDKHGRTLKTHIKLMPGMELTMVAADKQLAQADVSPPQIMASFLVRPATGSVRMGDARKLRSAEYDLTLKPGAKLDQLDLPQTGYQRVVQANGRSARVVMDLDQPVDAKGDAPTKADLAASMTLNKDDPKIQKLVRRAFGGNGSLNDAEKARKLQRFVHRYMTRKDLSVGFATASEVARTKEGDCTEHAVLLAAMLRAANVPSRVATGLVYVDRFLGKQRVFGGHMWAQAWVGGHWVDVDATLPENTGEGFDAAHIALGVATLDENAVTNELVKMAPLLGSLDVKVVKASR